MQKAWKNLEQKRVLPDCSARDMVSDILHIPINVFHHANEMEERKYTVFNETQESWISFRILSVLYNILFLGGLLPRLEFLTRQNVQGWDYTSTVIYLVVNACLMLIYWWIMYLRRNDTGSTLNARKAVDLDSYSGSSLKVKLQSIFVIGITLLYCYWLLLRVVAGQCEQTLSFYNFRCNPNQERDGLPIESLVILMFIPMTFCVAFRGTPFVIQVVSWVISIVGMFSTAAFVRVNQNIPIFLVYIPASLFMIYENERQNRVTFMVTERLSYLLEENERLADETHANELRHMVGNVAHDLRTPLTSFLNCMDMMGTTLESFHRASCEGEMASAQVQSNVESLNELLGGLRNASTFMSMAINRCLDFTKSSKGIALTANLETVNLHTVLKLPLRVVTDMQSRIGIHQDPLPDDVCSHIVTDLQWLQENFLCLLSNAVKYTVSGSVAIRFVLHDATALQYTGDELDAGIFTSARVHPVSFTSAAAALTGSQIPGQGVVSHLPSVSGDDWHQRTLYNSNNNLHEERYEPRDPEGHTLNKYEKRSEKSVHIAFTEVSIRKIPGGVIFISRQMLRATESAKVDRKTGLSNRRYLRFEVLDCGIGLAEDAMLTLFHPFRRAQRLNGGVGLGLYSLAKRTEALGGYYGVSSRGDGQQGCKFFFAIPYTPDPLAASLRSKPLPAMLSFVRKDKVVTAGESFLMENAPSRNTSISVGSTKSIRHVLHILVVDDSMAILKMTSMILRKQGHEVETALHGAEALDKLELARFKKVNPFDLVLMDLQMPVMDGLEAIRRIRSGERERREMRKGASAAVLFAEDAQMREIEEEATLATLHLEEGRSARFSVPVRVTPDHQKIIAMSANSDLTASGAALAAGADRFIAKPFTIQTLNGILEELEGAVEAGT